MNTYVQQALLANITVESLIIYLQQNGWVRRDNYAYQKLIVFDFHLPFHETDISLVFPSKKEYKDFHPRVLESIQLLSYLEERPLQDIIFDIVKPNTDRIEIKLRGMHQQTPLPIMVKFLDGIRKLIQNTIKNELDPKQLHYGRSKNVVVKYINEFNFCITQDNNTIITLESPDRGIYRKTILRMQHGLSKIEEQFTSKTKNNILDDYRTGFNQNMYQDLIKVYEILPLDTIELNFRFSRISKPLSKLPNKYSINNSLIADILDRVRENQKHVSPDYFPDRTAKLEAPAASKVTESEQISKIVEDFRIQGYIVELSIRPSNNNLYGRIRVLYDGIPVIVNLNFEDYRHACDAHRDGKQAVIHGKFRIDGKEIALLHLTSFSII